MRASITLVLVFGAVVPGCGGSGQNDLPPVFPGWAVQAGGLGSDGAFKVAVFSNGESVVVGGFRGEMTFGEGEANETTLVAAGGADDLFVARYHEDGTLLWARRDGGPRNDLGYDVDVVPDGTCVVVGIHGDDSVFGAGEPSEETLFTEDPSFSATFVARYDVDGSMMWVASAPGGADNAAYGIGTLPDGSSVVSGHYNVSITLGAGEGNETTLADPGSPWQLFVARYSRFGGLVWARGGNVSIQVLPYGVDTTVDGTSFVTGRLQGTLSLGPGANREAVTVEGSNDAFLLCYDGDGVPQWGRAAGGPDYLDEGRDVAALADGTAAMTGFFIGDATFGSGEANETTLSSDGDRDVFYARYDSGGTLLWAKRAGGPGYDSAEAICAHGDGSLFVSGIFSDVATFGLGEAREKDVTSAGAGDVFVARLYPDGLLRWVQRAGGPGTDSAWGIGVRTDHSSIVSGRFSDTAEFGSGVFGETLTSAGGVDLFLARYGPNGEL